MPTEADIEYGKNVVRRIRQQKEAERDARPVLVTVAFRLPVELHRELKQVAKRLDVTMTSILVAALETFLPILQQIPADFDRKPVRRESQTADAEPKSSTTRVSA